MKAILIALLVLTLGAGGVLAADPLGDEVGTDRTIPLATSTGESTTTESGEDVPGPCDEPEHANDPRCTGGTVTGDDDRDEDRSGPNRGRDDDHGDDDHDEDRSGSNSGRG